MTPADWDILQLRRLADCWDHLRIPMNAEERHHREGKVPYWGASTIQGYVDSALVDEEVVLIGEDGAPFFERDRPVAFHITEPIWPNNHIHVLKPRRYVDARWLTYALNDVDYSLYVGGSTRDKLTQGALMRILLPVPSASQQRAIADYLDRETAKIDTLIEEQQRLIETLKERRAATIADKLPEVDGTRLKRVAMVQSGVTLSGEGDPDDPEWPYLRVANVQVGRVELGEVKTIRVPATVAREAMLQAGDVLMTEGGDIDKLGRGALWAGEIEPMLHQNHIFAVRTEERLDSEYLTYWLDGPVARNYFRTTAKKTTNLAATNRWTLGNLPVACPPLSEQRRIVAFLDEQTAKIDELIAETERFIELSRERRAALITAAVTGQIDVWEAA